MKFWIFYPWGGTFLVTRCVNYSKEKSLNFLHLYSMKTQHAIHDFFALFFHFYFMWYWYSISSFFIGWRRKMHLFYHFLTNKKNQSLRCSLLYCFFMSEDHFERRVLYRNFLHTYLVYILFILFLIESIVRDWRKSLRSSTRIKSSCNDEIYHK